MEFSRQEYWSGLPFPTPGDLLNPGIEPESPALQADSLPSEPQIVITTSCYFLLYSKVNRGLSWWFSGKESACNAGDSGSIPGLGRSPGEGNDYTLQYPCLENPMDQKSLAGYSPQSHKELDRNEQLTISLSKKMD